MCQILEHMIWINHFIFKQVCKGTSLVAQWLRLHLLNPGGQVPSLVRKLDPTCLN